MHAQLPDAVKATLWSYDLDKMDLESHKDRIITQVLNWGTHEAVAWLFNTYPRQQMARVVAHPRPGEWNRKSLNYWALMFDVQPMVTARFP